ncbi:DEAD-box ATP-dependent RNA helicase 22 [Babesia caballi]|uniref:ATP-dependent RNA helicase n=1 Tax=Babesia caballi TaxID=5871 RepID=A0AAV4LM20_BABCB|nr:DEAD-box ATP-dependent RNA helicase 22 [Babesia caballi]
MTRRLPLSVYGRLSSSSFDSRPLIEGFRRSRNNRAGPSAAEPTPGSVARGNTAGDADSSAPASRVKLHPLLRLALLRSRGISQLNNIQESTFLSILSGKDVTLHAPVGAGKTLAYLLPIVNNIYNIHDLLEDLQLRSGDGHQRDAEDRIRTNALGYSRRVPHALLPRSMSDLRQDPLELESSAAKALQTLSTAEKLVETLCKVDPKHLQRRASPLPLISRSLWGRRCRNSVFRALLSNPLGSVRCCVVVVPNKDLVSQVVSELHELDPLGRLSVQTLTQVHRVPPRAPAAEDGGACADPSDQPFYPSPHALHHLSGLPGTLRLSLEDERAMIRAVPTVQVSEEVIETVPVNMGRSKRNLVRAPGAATATSTLPLPCAGYSVDGLVPRSVEFVRRPVMTHPVIQYGSCDIVVTTPQLFLNDILSSRRLGVVPACVVFDEVDTLFENNASRSAMMEICSHLRPRPRLYNPLVQHQKRSHREPPPCQFVHVASTLNYGGLQTTGSMLYERFTSSHLVSTCLNHHLASCDLRFIDVEAVFESKLRRLVEVLVASPFAKTVVYVASLEGVRKVSDLLRDKDWPVLSFHSRSSLATRLALLETYRSEDIVILVCTDLFARGLDVPADHVIHFSFPRDAATFVHRIKGSPSLVTGLIEPGDVALASELHRAHVWHRPVNRLLSRKRSFRNRLRRALETGDAPALAHARGGVSRRPKGATTATKKSSSVGASPTLDDYQAHLDYDEAGNDTVRTASPHAQPNNEPHGGRTATYTAKDATRDIGYRRRSLKSRGMEFYDNFRAFS